MTTSTKQNILGSDSSASQTKEISSAKSFPTENRSLLDIDTSYSNLTTKNLEASQNENDSLFGTHLKEAKDILQNWI